MKYPILEINFMYGMMRFHSDYFMVCSLSRRLVLRVAKPNVYRVISFFLPLIPDPSPARGEGRFGSVASHAIANAISLMLDDPLSLRERARVRGAGRHNAHFVKSGRVQ